MDPWAAGLYLVPPEARMLIPAGAAPDFAEALLTRCLTLDVDIVLPTVDAELRPLAYAREKFAAAGIALLLADAAALEVILDKLSLARHCADVVRVPRTELFGPDVDPASWTYPAVVKPRTGSGSRGIVIVGSAAELAALDRSPSLIVQDFLPGEEYSVDVLADADGHVIASRPAHPGPGRLGRVGRRPHGARPRDRTSSGAPWPARPASRSWPTCSANATGTATPRCSRSIRACRARSD